MVELGYRREKAVASSDVCPLVSGLVQQLGGALESIFGGGWAEGSGPVETVDELDVGGYLAADGRRKVKSKMIRHKK